MIPSLPFGEPAGTGPAVVLHSVQEDAPAVQEGREGGRPCEKGRKIRNNWRVKAATAGGERERERARAEKRKPHLQLYIMVYMCIRYMYISKKYRRMHWKIYPQQKMCQPRTVLQHLMSIQEDNRFLR